MFPPGDVYDDGFGGIDSVQWTMNPWGETSWQEVTEGCYDGSASCIRIDSMEQWGGLHIYYNQPFPPDTFETLSLVLKAVDGSGELQLAPSLEGERCIEETVQVAGNDWITVEFILSEACADFDAISAVTLANNTESFSFLIDAIWFE